MWYFNLFTFLHYLHFLHFFCFLNFSWRFTTFGLLRLLQNYWLEVLSMANKFPDAFFDYLQIFPCQVFGHAVPDLVSGELSVLVDGLAYHLFLEGVHVRPAGDIFFIAKFLAISRLNEAGHHKLVGDFILLSTFWQFAIPRANHQPDCRCIPLLVPALYVLHHLLCFRYIRRVIVLGINNEPYLLPFIFKFSVRPWVSCVHPVRLLLMEYVDRLVPFTCQWIVQLCVCSELKVKRLDWSGKCIKQKIDCSLETHRVVIVVTPEDHWGFRFHHLIYCYYLKKDEQ